MGDYWTRPLRIRPCLCGHDEFDHSRVLVGDPCLDCDCPAFMSWLYADDTVPQPLTPTMNLLERAWL